MVAFVLFGCQAAEKHVGGEALERHLCGVVLQGLHVRCVALLRSLSIVGAGSGAGEHAPVYDGELPGIQPSSPLRLFSLLGLVFVIFVGLFL